ncbi:hypothetical protein MKW98_029618 [Papaver atlanticum]|uniref:Uncharacterized protein n=1 Tax=Papaver atlanticum TaxID=357466 RepID=A0AAD4T7P0_9MAGN|nr:hypothetical protein MKW98_029618 [Papaver atlanticum]
MGSQDGFNGCEQPEALLLCQNGCGFFGTAANMNMCSKCYRDYLKAEEQSALVKAAFEEAANPKKVLATSPTESPDIAAKETTAVLSSSGSSTSATSGGESDAVTKNRCFSCNKKVGLTGIKCKCGSVFCSLHRYPEKHSCDFDYKSVGRETLARLNPQVKADKIDRF